MDKTAQRRGAGAKVHEALSPGRVLSKFFDPQFKKVWDSLVQKDNTIRSILSGEKVDKNILPGITIDKEAPKALLTKAKSYLNQREFISAVSSLATFHKKMQDAVNVIKLLDEDVSKIHHEFLFGRKMPDKKYMERLTDLEQRIASQNLEFIKRAGLIDSLKNLFTERGRALKAWEKRYEDRVRPIRDGVARLIESSSELYNTVLAHLKAMASFRAARKIDAYIDEAKKISQAFEQYDKGKDGFRNFYNNSIKPFVAEQRRLEAERAASANIPANVPAAAEPTGNVSVPQQVAPPSGSGQTLPGVGGPGTPELRPPPLPDDADVPTIPSPPRSEEEAGFKSDKVFQDIVRQQAEKAKARAGSQQLPLFKQRSDQFIASLEAMSAEDPKILAGYISKYAYSIQIDDPETALQLFNVAKSLRG